MGILRRCASVMLAVLLAAGGGLQSAQAEDLVPGTKDVLVSESEVESDPLFERYMKNEDRLRTFEDPQDETSNVDTAISRTRNPVSSKDNAVGHLIWKNYKRCTASHVGGRYWLTAAHCEPESGYHIGFIVTPDDNYAGVESWTTIDDHDFMLVRVGTGLTGQPSFSLPNSSIRDGSVLNLTGYWWRHSFPSTTKVVSEGYQGKVEYSGGDSYQGVTRFRVKNGDYNMGKGDSGAPIYDNDRVIRAVVSGGQILDDDKGYDYLEDQKVYGTETYYHKRWIGDAKSLLYRTTNWRDVWDSYQGGKMAQRYLDRGRRVPGSSTPNKGGSS